MTEPQREGRKDDTGKDPWDLAPFDAFRAIVGVLAFGAKKYTTEFSCDVTGAATWLTQHLQTLDPSCAIQIAVDTARGFADPATNDSFVHLIRSTPSASAKTDAHGVSETKSASENIRSAEKPAPSLVSAMPTHIARDASGALASQQTTSNASAGINRIGVQSAGGISPTWVRRILITVTQPDGSEASYAADATTASACFAKIQNFCVERFPTLKSLSRIKFSGSADEITVIIPGARNWEQGMAWSRLYAATFRHLTAWWGGERTDQETGLSHLAHAGCCVCFLIAFELRGIGTDDRPEGSR